MLVRRILLNLHKQVSVTSQIIPKCHFHSTSIQEVSFKRRFKQLWSYPNAQNMSPPWGHCAQIGDPVLRQVSSEVPKEHINDESIQLLIKQMENVLNAYRLVGIAAPQIGISLRIILIQFKENLKENFTPEVYRARQMQTLPLTTFINPVLKVINYNQKTFPEGCASICGYTADVSRYEEIQLSGFNENGEFTELKLNGWNARIAQHEMDHLNGQLYTDIMHRKTFTSTVWEACNANGGELSIPFYPKQ